MAKPPPAGYDIALGLPQQIKPLSTTASIQRKL